MSSHAHHPYHTLPWLERLSVHVAGYQDSLDRGDRRGADRAIRAEVLRRLGQMHSRLEGAVRDCLRREATSFLPVLERTLAHLDRVIDRIRANDSRIETSYDEARIDPAKAAFLHEAHLAVFQQADALLKHFDEPDLHHDRLAHVEADLQELERRLDEKARGYGELD